jgi:1,4-alpha-glucan branching enzyme
MGVELGQWLEWNAGRGLDWELLDFESHRGIQHLHRDLNRLYLTEAPLYDLDFDGEGFSWVDCHDADQSVISFLRRARNGRFLLVALNFTPVPRHGYRLGVPGEGQYAEIFNSDSGYYGGSNIGNGDGIVARAGTWMGLPASIDITLPPLAALIIAPR